VDLAERFSDLHVRRETQFRFLCVVRWSISVLVLVCVSPQAPEVAPFLASLWVVFVFEPYGSVGPLRPKTQRRRGDNNSTRDKCPCALQTLG
jgi:hypothetical protein